MANREGDFTFLIQRNLGVISSHTTGWKKELNIVQWNGGNPKYDIRDWDPDHEHMSRGVTLREEEAKELAQLLNKHFEKSTEREKEAETETTTQQAQQVQDVQEVKEESAD